MPVTTIVRSRRKKLRVAVLGTGFMARAHTRALAHVAQIWGIPVEIVLQVVYSYEEEDARKFGDRWGFAQCAWGEGGWKDVVKSPDVDIVVICLPNHLHHPVVLAASKAGKIIVCEKPIALNGDEGAEMVEAVGDRPNMVAFCYLREPAVAQAKRGTVAGRIGTPFHLSGAFDQDWTIAQALAMGGKQDLWRLDKVQAGSGVTGDLISHWLNLAEYLNGPIRIVQAMTRIFVPQRTDADSGEVRQVEIDDAAQLMFVFDNGSIGTAKSTRYARGNKAEMSFEFNGDDGAYAWTLRYAHILRYSPYRFQAMPVKVDADGPDPEPVLVKIDGAHAGWQELHMSSPGDHPYMDLHWVPGLQEGYGSLFVHQWGDFLLTAYDDLGREPVQQYIPTMAEALKTQRLCDAVLASAGDGQRYMRTPESGLWKPTTMAEVKKLAP